MLHRSWWSCVLLVAVAGCGGGDSGSHPPTFPVTGAVTYKGSPVADATVTFVPQQKDQAGAFGRTDANGQYTLTSFEAGDGAVAGKFFVTVTKIEGQAVASSGPGIDETSPDYEPPPDNPRPEPPPKSLIPMKYSQIATSKLETTVTEGDNTFDIPLTD